MLVKDSARTGVVGMSPDWSAYSRIPPRTSTTLCISSTVRYSCTQFSVPVTFSTHHAASDTTYAAKSTVSGCAAAQRRTQRGRRVTRRTQSATRPRITYAWAVQLDPFPSQ